MDALLAQAERIAGALTRRGESVAVAESSSGGLVSAALLSVAGASGYYRGGGVIYTAAAREALLGLDAAAMAGLRPATEPYALLLAGRARERLGATWGLGESGAAGPAGNRYGDPPGHCCCALDGPVSRSLTLSLGPVGRWPAMLGFAHGMLDLLEQALGGS